MSSGAEISLTKKPGWVTIPTVAGKPSIVRSPEQPADATRVRIVRERDTVVMGDLLGRAMWVAARCGGETSIDGAIGRAGGGTWRPVVESGLKWCRVDRALHPTR